MHVKAFGFIHILLEVLFPKNFFWKLQNNYQIQLRLLQYKLSRRKTKSLPNPGALGRGRGGCFMTGGSADGS